MALESLDAERVPNDMRGYLEIEDEELKFFTRRFFIFLRDTGLLDFYKEDPLLSSSAQKYGSIDISNITKVCVSTQRPKKENCFEIGLTDKTYYLAAQSHQSMSDWVDRLHEAATNPRTRARSQDQRRLKQDSIDDGKAYQTSIVGGVVVKTLKDSDSMDKNPNRGGLRLLMEGWCFKQGAVMKSWKRRYFTLSVVKLCYYLNREEKEPIRSILTQDLLAVREAIGFSGRSNVLEIETPYRKFYLQPDSKEEMKTWKKAIEEVKSSSVCPPKR
eukprot:Seg1055.8 transcript_id=Seg1055.8/GoldUCD/mRNA.D3Y31 product="Pleckstrin-like domain-containing family A member 2" protein_id=Seg1055.8/GoldUCD/D3Y31